jgi:hypothetical protein
LLELVHAASDWGTKWKKNSKLLGFGSISHQINGSVDFQDEDLAAKLGAKVGIDPPPPPPAEPFKKIAGISAV